MNRREDKFEISEARLKDIIGDDWVEFKRRIFNNVYCSDCDSNYNSTIVNYRIFINDLNDIILEGFCKKCTHRVARYVETGENQRYVQKISKILSTLN